jgi:hypothetical protein
MKTIGILLIAAICFTGCKKSQELPSREASKTVITTEFSVTSDSLKFIIPIEAKSGVKEITVQGKLTTSLSPEYSSYVMLSVGDSVVWHSSFMASTVDFCTKDLKSLFKGSGINCTLDFYNVENIHGPFKCSGQILVSYSE